MRANLERSSAAAAVATLPVADDLSASAHATVPAATLAQLPLGARLILRCRKDWRTAVVAAIALDAVTLSVCSPSGHTYRVRRPHDAPLTYDGRIPLLCTGEAACWRAALARYDARW
ncbi:MAG TPA: hypothetical protein VF525_00905 [Pyrinomonadaceae bacterium]